MCDHFDGADTDIFNAQKLSKQIRTSILHPHSDHYNPIPAAACLLDPMVASVLLATEFTALQNAEKSFIISLEDESVLSNFVEQNELAQDSSQSSHKPFSFEKFNILSNKLCSKENSTPTHKLFLLLR